MKIFSAAQIRKCDAFTIQHEPVSSLQLMERAAEACVNVILTLVDHNAKCCIFCGNGNNGGDGFAVARLLFEKGVDVEVYVDQDDLNFSDEAEANYRRIQELWGIAVFDFNDWSRAGIRDTAIIIDALFGTGLNRSIEGKSARLINRLNECDNLKISLDIPSGLFADKRSAEGAPILVAAHTLSFQFWKKTFLHPETAKFCGKIHILDIGLRQDFIRREPASDLVTDEALIHQIYRPRSDFSHKGTYGKTCIVAGSYGKMGAAVLATKSATKTGCGITVTIAPDCGYEILQTSCPEAMFISGGDRVIRDLKVENDFHMGLGPGVGTDPETETAVLYFLKTYRKPLVLDADGLNILAGKNRNLSFIPENSIITPHPKEFERMFGESDDSFQRVELARKKSGELNIFIVLKDHHTQIITPEGQVFYNITGNSGMAKGGSGDVLLGIITSLLAQNYSPEASAVLGVWLHGKAGDLAAERCSKEAMLPSDLIDELGNAFKSLH